MKLANDMTDLLKERFTDCEVIWAVSPLVQSNCGQRVFRSEIKPYSTNNVWYNVQEAGVPKLRHDVETAGHGLVHIDHRLLDYDAQEMSVVASCALVNAMMFVPPFNHYNEITKEVCDKNLIELVEYDDGWKSAEYNKFNDLQELWYLHHREWTLDKFKEWIK